MLAASASVGAGHAEQTAPAPAVMAPGAPLDPSGFRYQRPLAPGDPGLVTLPLDAAVLAHSQGPSRSFADVRVVDANNAQIPYLLERRDERLSLDLELRSATPQARALRDRPGNRSFYAITLPFENLPGPVVALQTSGTVFRRLVQLGVERPPDRRRREAAFEPLTQAVWEHADATTRAAARALPAIRALAGAAADRRRRGQQAAADDRGEAAASRVAAAVPSPARPAEIDLWEGRHRTTRTTTWRCSRRR